MRITGGQKKGRRLASLKGLDIRPSSDKVKESIFNIIGQDLTGCRILDLFAGTGGLGIEALSRGAVWALFIDRSPLCIKLIHRNLDLTGYGASGSVLRQDLTKGLPMKHPLMTDKFDIIFIDPPYGKGLIPPILKELSSGDLMNMEGLIITESYKGEILPSSCGFLQRIKTRSYGETKLEIYECKD